MRRVFICGTSGNGKSELLQRLSRDFAAAPKQVAPRPKVSSTLEQLARMTNKAVEYQYSQYLLYDRSLFDHMAWASFDTRPAIAVTTSQFAQLLSESLPDSDDLFVVAPNNPNYDPRRVPGTFLELKDLLRDEKGRLQSDEAIDHYAPHFHRLWREEIISLLEAFGRDIYAPEDFDTWQDDAEERIRDHLDR